MSLSLQIRAYLIQSNIVYDVGDYKTGKPDGQEDQILHWDAKLGARPTQAQLDTAWAIQASIDERAAYASRRAAEYPPMTDYIDGIVKGDQAQVQAYIDACLAVKAKYPKP
jgi:hypothetical protein